ncbi:MAG: SUMF1/EgtB/PvdO family nonheme iron enzyme, partial [Amphiplicatus sp.]
MGQISVLHAEENRGFACNLAAALAADGHSVWRSEEGAPAPGRPHADAVVVVWPKRASVSVADAARKALARRVLVPVSVGDVEPPASFSHLWPIDLAGWEKDRDDPRWQFVRDEIRLALLRREGVPRSGARPREPGWGAPALPMRIIVATAVGCAIGAGAIIMVTPPGDKSAAPARAAATVERQPRNIRDGDIISPPAEAERFAARAPSAALETASETVAGTAPEIETAAKTVSPPPEDSVVEDAASGDMPTSQYSALAPPARASVDAAAPPVGEAEETEPALTEAAQEPSAKETPLKDEGAPPPLPPPPEDRFAGVVFRDCADCPDMAEIHQTARLGANGVTPVSLTSGAFALSRREVTFTQWEACVEDGGCGAYDPSDAGWGRGRRPVINVSFADAEAYVDWLSKKTGRSYRLPTEREWEYAADAGGDQSAALEGEPSPRTANYSYDDGPAREKTVPAGSFPHSLFGLYDMRGNVAEWVADCWRDEASGVADCTKRI